MIPYLLLVKLLRYVVLTARKWVPLESLEKALHDETVAAVLNNQELDWLLRRVAEVRDELATLHWPLGVGLIHGDAWTGNLLWADPACGHVLLGDWDRVAYGPREVDLIPMWCAKRRYSKPPDWIENFVAGYHYDLSQWAGYEPLLEMRDLVQISGPLRRAPFSSPHAAALRQRLDSLRSGDKYPIVDRLMTITEARRS